MPSSEENGVPPQLPTPQTNINSELYYPPSQTFYHPQNMPYQGFPPNYPNSGVYNPRVIQQPMQGVQMQVPQQIYHPGVLPQGPQTQQSPPQQQQPLQQQPPFPPSVQLPPQGGPYPQQSPTSQHLRKRLHSNANAVSRITSTYPRRRALTACDTCRLKKIKCDNVRPRCGACSKNGNTNCHYRTDDQGTDYSSYDPASINILTKLDIILKDVKQIKTGRADPLDTLASIHFDKCLWDMSLTSILKWRAFESAMGDSPAASDKLVRSIVATYDHASYEKVPSYKEQLTIGELVERLVAAHFSDFINSFFVTLHTKIPVLDVLSILEAIEVYQVLHRADRQVTFILILDQFDPNGGGFDELVNQGKLDDTPARRRAYNTLAHLVPLLLVVCALGILATPVQLDNLGKFMSSLEERKDLGISCLANAQIDNLPSDRHAIAQSFIRYAHVISTFYPFTLKPNTLVSVEFHLLMNQFHLFTFRPQEAYSSIVKACHNIMFYLEVRKGPGGTYVLDENLNKREIIDRLFWLCLKLESELRTEISPYGPVSGITNIVPSSSFPKIPEPLSNVDDMYSNECLALANKYDDLLSWYYFLTEVAVRKVDNAMFDELFSHESVLTGLWDQDLFSSHSLYVLFIKYLNQYNGIINSLSPKIRNFVLQEYNVEQIYKSMKKRFNKKQLNIKTEDIFDNLDDFLIDDDLLLRAQSESIMFIKTRIITSKLVLFRPIVYLILEGKVAFGELLQAVIELMPVLAKMQQPQVGLDTFLRESEDSPSLSTGNDTGLNASQDLFLDINGTTGTSTDEDLNYLGLLDAPLLYQKQFPDEDFTEVIEYEDEAKRSHEFKLKDVARARIKIFKVFIQNLISLPKLNMPKLGAHRHAGLWYYVRNMVIGNIYMFLLYKHLDVMVAEAAGDAELKSQFESAEGPGLADLLGVFKMLISKDGLKALLEHLVIVLDYWKDESVDCAIYRDIIQRCIERID